jgi:hypothetical protein
MRTFIITTLLIVVELYSIARAKEEGKPLIMPAQQLCSEIVSNENTLKELKGKELTIHGRVSSIGDKRTAYLGNRIDSIVELVIIPEPKKDPFGKEISDTGCYISCFINVPGERCEHRDGKLECLEITNPKLEENMSIILDLRGGESITVGGEFTNLSLIPLYSIGGHKRQIVNAVISKCGIIETTRKGKHPVPLRTR